MCRPARRVRDGVKGWREGGFMSPPRDMNSDSPSPWYAALCAARSTFMSRARAHTPSHNTIPRVDNSRAVAKPKLGKKPSQQALIQLVPALGVARLEGRDLER